VECEAEPAVAHLLLSGLAGHQYLSGNFRRAGAGYLSDLAVTHEFRLCPDLSDAALRYVIVVAVKPAALDAEILGHPVKVLHGVGQADEVAHPVDQVAQLAHRSPVACRSR